MGTTAIHPQRHAIGSACLGLLCFALLSACSTRPARDTPTATAPADTPAAATTVTYRGILPCPDCDGLDVELVLDHQEKIYRVTETRLAENGTPDTAQRSVGQWRRVTGNDTDPDAVIYQLDFDRPGSTRNFLRLDDDRIKLLDEFKREFWSPFNLLLDIDR
ncbi:copper resistance protein NlpE N-terminal domain-containing protein [Isoalcanivorax indicus]|uniref:copper resistance protein NlpE N-terminal domain-containing protein n=1 Tax=Isoalcanivorax indicus TaxID=2202653 RepID=UPI000DBA253A|nr:copper resistance protein NlpE N-terminal domain-containing protein [Isoalcanivorax indicus]